MAQRNTATTHIKSRLPRAPRAHRSSLVVVRVALAALLLGSVVAATACTVGDPNAPVPGEVDASGGGGGDGGGGGGDGGNAACEPLVMPAPNGHHNPGQNCIEAGCHDGGTAGVPLFTIAGTLYSARNGVTGKPGATILIPAGNGNPIKMITADNGNFWREAPTTLPARMKASVCPSVTVEMPSQAADGNCNSCHGPNARIALP
jgi:hypothetical protein